MNGVWLGTRLAVAWELPALERARQRDMDQALAVLAGLMSGDPEPAVPQARSVIDLSLDVMT